MTPVTLLAIQFAVVAALVVAVALWLRLRQRTRWATWGWGALAFAGSQAVRLALLSVLTLALASAFKVLDANVGWWLNALVLCLTSGLFEEGARWLVLSRWAKKDRSYSDGLMFGAGHGGFEALVVVGVGAMQGIVLLTSGDVLIAQVQASAPGQVAALQAQIVALQGLQWTGIVLGIWERILAMTLHVCLALTVLRTVREGRLGWLWLAMVIHAGYNLVALVTVQYAGALATEAVLTVLTLGAVWAMWRGSKARMSGGTTQRSLV